MEGIVDNARYEDDAPNWQTSSDEDDSGSDDDNGAGHVIPQLFVRTPSLVGPARLVPLAENVQQSLAIEPHLFSFSFSKCNYHKVQDILEAMNSSRMSTKNASELLSKTLKHDAHLLNLFTTTYPSIFAEGTEDYAFTVCNSPLVLRPDYHAQQDESSVRQGQNYDHKVRQWCIYKDTVRMLTSVDPHSVESALPSSSSPSAPWPVNIPSALAAASRST
jgi:hypothetical protein